jgi:hypothetical protein
VLLHLHPLLQKHLDSFGQMEGKFADFLKGHTCVALWASPASLDRALRIMATLFDALEARGGRIEVTKHEPNFYGLYHAKPSQTGVWFGESFISFSLSESTKIVMVPPPSPAPHLNRPSKWDSAPSSRPPEPTKTNKPSGILTLRLEGRSWVRPSYWADGKQLALQGRLHEIVKAMEADAERMRLEVIADREQESKAIEDRKRRDEAERRQREEEARLFDLWSRVEDFTLAQRAKAYLQEVEAGARATGADLLPGSALGAWLAWARTSVERQERGAIETILGKRQQPEEEAPRRSWEPQAAPERAWGYWARSYKGR